MILPASVVDAVGAAALLSAAYDDRLATAGGVRHRLSTTRPEDRARWWKAERSGMLVGWAFAGLDAFSPLRTAAYAGVVTHPSWRGQGVGTALWDEVAAHLGEIGATRIVAHSTADAESAAFAEARSFTLEGTYTSSACDPRAVGAIPPQPPPGTEILPASALAHDLETIFAADSESALDEPGPHDFSGMTFETWRRFHWDNPECDHELSAVAVADDGVVGTSFLFSDRGGRLAANGGTGVMRAYRGKGLGLLMKQHSLAWAASAGITRVMTQNDTTNAPMLAINARLGYQPFSVGHDWVLER